MVAFNTSFLDDGPPPLAVLRWCKQLVRVLKHGGVWGIPRSETLFRVDHVNKKLVCIGLGPDGDDSDFYATQRVFKHIGWGVVFDEAMEQKHDADN